ncbi:MAG: Beta-galactosidase [Paenibacillus sp.]|nr:Beta-galactosidase [Paenibacillus sp.]
MLDSRIASKVGILFDWDNWWAVELGGGPSAYLKYLDQIQSYYDAFYDNHIQVDLIHVGSDLGQYELVLAPLLYMLKPGYAEKLEQFVQNGGTFVTTFYSGIVDTNDKVIAGGYPGELRKLLGIWVEEIDALFPDQKNQMVMQQEVGQLQGSHECRLACEVVHLEGAEAVAVFGSDYYRGSPALTRHGFGKGEAWYAATDPSRGFKMQWMKELCDRKRIYPLIDAPQGVEITQREKDGVRFTFVLNHSGHVQTLHIGSSQQKELLSGANVQGKVELEPNKVMILKSADL